MSNNTNKKSQFTANEKLLKLFDEFLFFEKWFFSIPLITGAIIAIFIQDVPFHRLFSFMGLGLYLLPKINQFSNELIKAKNAKVIKYLIICSLFAFGMTETSADFIPNLIISTLFIPFLMLFTLPIFFMYKLVKSFFQQKNSSFFDNKQENSYENANIYKNYFQERNKALCDYLKINTENKVGLTLLAIIFYPITIPLLFLWYVSPIFKLNSPKKIATIAFVIIWFAFSLGPLRDSLSSGSAELSNTGIIIAALIIGLPITLLISLILLIPLGIFASVKNNNENNLQFSNIETNKADMQQKITSEINDKISKNTDLEPTKGNENNSRIILNNNKYQARSCNKSSKLRFYTKTDIVELFGYKITDAIFYTCDTKSTMPFAINTNIKPSFENTSSTWLGYWPNYSELNRMEKGCYIKWLAEGKPYINELGYAYIYFYGLEYRALIEKQDLKMILFEVIELANKFKQLRYGFDLIVYLIFSIKDFSQEEKDIILKFLKDNERKYLYNTEYNSLIKLLTPKEKYKVKFLPYQFLNNNEYNNLSDRKNEILSYYLDKIIENLDENEIYATKKQNYAYYMAMQGYYGTKVVTYEPIVPSLKLKRLWNQARKIIKEEITQSVKNFDSSSKALTEIEILAYLPEELRKNINYSFGNFEFDEKQITNINTIAKKLKFKMQDKLTLRQSSLIVDACEALGYTIEPNANINKKTYKKDAEILLYKNNNSELSLSNNYQIASLFMDIGYQIALEDNELLESEIAYIENYIQNEFNLTTPEKIRLQMRGELIIHTREVNTSETIKKLISALDDAGKETIAKYIISVAMADGIVKDKELKILHKIFKQFNFSEEYLNSTLSKLIDNTDEIVVVEKGVATNKKGSKIPINIDTAEKIEFKLDINKLEKIKTNTSEIHSVLQEIFADEQVQELKQEPIEQTLIEDKDTPKLENNLQDIINIIVEKETWTRNELLNVIHGKGIMLGSIVESINEWSEEAYGDFLIEEDDNIYIINQDVVGLMNNKR